MRREHRERKIVRKKKEKGALYRLPDLFSSTELSAAIDWVGRVDFRHPYRGQREFGAPLVNNYERREEVASYAWPRWRPDEAVDIRWWHE